jgi:hypothetical protein
MRKLATTLAITALTIASFATHAAETANVVEVFTCSYNDGKGPADLDAAIEFWNAQIDKIDNDALNGYNAGVLTPLRATLEGDFIWIGGAGNLNVAAAALSASTNSKEGQAATARFAEVADCDSNQFFSTPVYVGTPPGEDDGQAIVELYGCTLNDGKTLADAEAAEKSLSDMASAAKSGINVFRWTPFLANTPYDLVYLGVHDNLEDFGSFNTMSLTSEDGQANGALFAAAIDCESGLFSGRSVRTTAN